MKLVAQSCLTFCDPMDCSPPGSCVHGISQARIQGLGCPFSSPGDHPNPGIKPRFPALQADSLTFESTLDYLSYLMQCRVLCMLSRSVVSDSCDPIDCSLPRYSVHGIPQARILQSVAISFPRGSSWPRNWTWVSCIAGRFFTELWGKPQCNVNSM